MMPSVLNLLQQNRCVIRFREILKMLMKMDCIDVCFPKSCRSSGLIGKQTQVGGSSFFISSQLFLVNK